MSFFSKFFSVFGRTYESANNSTERHYPQLVVADACAELSPATRAVMISRTRDIVRNFGLAREAVGAMERYAVGDGIYPQASTQDEDWNQAAEKLFNEVFAKEPEITKRWTFGKLTRLVCRALDVDGEIFFVKKEDVNGRPRLHAFEAHRCAQKTDEQARIFDGIEFDTLGAPCAYYFETGDGEPERIEAKYVIHVFCAERVSDAHGVPRLQHAINALTDYRELLSIEKQGVKTLNEMAYVITSDKNELGASSGDFVYGAKGSAGGTDPNALKRQIGGGKVGKLTNGEKLESFISNRPSPTFQGFLETVFRDGCLGGVPYEFLADSSKIGGAGIRLVVGRAARVFEDRQNELIEQFLTPVWRYVIGWAIRNKKLPSRPDALNVEWACPKRVTVDAGRDAAQDRADLEAGLITAEDLYAARGMRFKTEIRRRAAELKYMQKIADEYGVPLEALKGK